MKTQYILKLKDFIASVITEEPQTIYWNRGLQKEQDSINLVSLCRLFHNQPEKSPEQIEVEEYNNSAFGLTIEDYSERTKEQLYNRAKREADRELTQLEELMEFESGDKLINSKLELMETLIYKL